MIYVFLIAAIIALAILYKFLPTRKTFFIVCAFFIAVFGVSFLIRQQILQEEISQVQLEKLQMRQKIFGEWYAAYQKDIDQLDRNWQLYHNIIDGLNGMDEQNFNAEAVHTRLADLEQESIDEQLKIYMLYAPPNLNKESRILVEAVIRKTQNYVDAQTRTISLSKTAANPPVDLETLRLKLHDIMIRESPEGLFTAQEISAIRSALGD